MFRSEGHFTLYDMDKVVSYKSPPLEGHLFLLSNREVKMGVLELNLPFVSLSVRQSFVNWVTKILIRSKTRPSRLLTSAPPLNDD